MIEKLKSVSNPLTIVAIFAGLAEVAGTVALALVDKSLQNVFVWFVMLFPLLLVVLFFITLNFNSRVLYAPSDFRTDESFLEMNKRLQSVSSAAWLASTSSSSVENLADNLQKNIIERLDTRYVSFLLKVANKWLSLGELGDLMRREFKAEQDTEGLDNEEKELESLVYSGATLGVLKALSGLVVRWRGDDASKLRVEISNETLEILKSRKQTELTKT